MQVKARMTSKPGFDLGMLVGGAVVSDEMERQVVRGIVIQMFEKAQEFLMAMAGLALRNYPTRDDIECREQGGGAVAEVIMRDPFGVAQAHRQHRLGTFQRLDLALLVHARKEG